MHEPNLRAVLLKNTGVQAAAQAVCQMLGLATSVVLSRYLGVEGFGHFNYIFAFFYFFLALSDFGINTIVVREVAKQRDRAGAIIGAMLSLKCLVATTGVLAAWAAIWVMEFPVDLRNALYVFALVLPLIALQLPMAIFQVLLKAEYPSLIGILNRSVGFALLMGAVWAGLGLTALAAGLLVGELAATLVGLRWSRRFVRPRWKLDVSIWREVLRSSLPLGVAGLFVASINRIDLIMLERLTNPHEVGLYAAAYKITNVLEAFPLMVMGTIYPVMSSYAGRDSRLLRDLYRKSLVGLGLVALPLGLGITLFAPVIVRLAFGAAFVGAERGLVVLVWSTVCLYLAVSGGQLLISMGRERVNLGVNVAGAALNVGLNLLLIPKLGFVGAAVATTSTYGFILVSILIASHVALGQSAPAPCPLALAEPCER